jgi:hypothetical protein
VVYEVDLRRGENTWERYRYDAANRVVGVDYGVPDVTDAASPAACSVDYELTPTGRWRRRTVREGDGRVRRSDEGVLTPRGAYRSLGDQRFEYDASGNRVTAEADGERPSERYRYDHASRLVAVERRNPAGDRTRLVEYCYDGLGRQSVKRTTVDGTSTDYHRVWRADRLLEEWVDGAPATSIVYGSGPGDPVAMVRHGEGGGSRLYYTRDGRGRISSVVDGAGTVQETYHYDVTGRAYQVPITADAEPLERSRVANPLLLGGQLYDDDSGTYATGDQHYDPVTGHTLGAAKRAPGPWIDTYVLPDENDGGGGMSGPGGVSMPGKDPFTGGFSPADSYIELIRNGEWLYDPTDGTWAWDPHESWLGHAVEHLGLHWIGHKIGHALGMGLGFASIIAGVIGLEDDMGGRSPGAWENHGRGGPGGGGHGPGGGGHGAGGGGHGPGGGGHGPGVGGTGRPTGQPEDRPTPGDRPPGSSTGGSGGSSGRGTGTSGGSGGSTSGGSSGGSGSGSSSSGSKPHEPVPDDDGNWVWGDTGQALTEEEKKDAGTKEGGTKDGGMPNPVDGGGEDLDKDWWRDLPHADAIGLAYQLKVGPKVDEREGTVTISPAALAGSTYLFSVLAPPVIEVEPGGEGVVLNLAGVQSTGQSSGTGTSDGWGDKPRSLVEAVAAPRIRGGAIQSRF